MKDNTQIQNQVVNAMQSVCGKDYKKTNYFLDLEKKLLHFISYEKNREINLTKIQNFIEKEKICNKGLVWLCFGFLYVKSVGNLRIFLNLAVQLGLDDSCMKTLIRKKFYCLCGKDKQTGLYNSEDIYAIVNNLLENDKQQLCVEGWKAFLNFVFDSGSDMSIVKSEFFEYVFDRFKAKLDSKIVCEPEKMSYFYTLLVITNFFDKNVIEKTDVKKNIFDDYIRCFEQYLAKSLNKSDLNLIFSVVLTLKNKLKSYEWGKLKNLPWIVQFATFYAKLELGIEVKSETTNTYKYQESIDEKDLFYLSRQDNVQKRDLAFDMYVINCLQDDNLLMETKLMIMRYRMNYTDGNKVKRSDLKEMHKLFFTKYTDNKFESPDSLVNFYKGQVCYTKNIFQDNTIWYFLFISFDSQTLVSYFLSPENESYTKSFFELLEHDNVACEEFAKLFSTPKDFLDFVKSCVDKNILDLKNNKEYDLVINIFAKYEIEHLGNCLISNKNNEIYLFLLAKAIDKHNLSPQNFKLTKTYKKIMSSNNISFEIKKNIYDKVKIGFDKCEKIRKQYTEINERYKTICESINDNKTQISDLNNALEATRFEFRWEKWLWFTIVGTIYLLYTRNKQRSRIQQLRTQNEGLKSNLAEIKNRIDQFDQEEIKYCECLKEIIDSYESNKEPNLIPTSEENKDILSEDNIDTNAHVNTRIKLI